MKITNNDPIGLYIGAVYMENPTKDKVLIDQQDRANRAIKHFANMPANRENCESLQLYIKEYKAECANRPDNEAKQELMSILSEIIDTLQTGIDRESSYSSQPSRQQPENGPTLWRVTLRQCYDRWRLFGGNHVNQTDPNTLEGYIRHIPNIVGMDFFAFMDKYGYTIMKKFMPPKDEDVKTEEASFKYVDRCAARIADKFVIVQMTEQKPTYTIIENQFPEAEKLYEFVMEQGVSEPVEPATAQAR